MHSFDLFKYCLSTSITAKLRMLLQCVFLNNKNILFLSDHFNFNYLPIDNKKILKRSAKSFKKIIKYFNVSVVIFIDLKKSIFFYKILQKYKIINITVGKSFCRSDFFIKLENNDISKYLFYLFILHFYLKIKNFSYSISGSTVFLI